MSYLNDLIDTYEHNNRPEEPITPLSIWISEKDKSSNSDSDNDYNSNREGENP